MSIYINRNKINDSKNTEKDKTFFNNIYIENNLKSVVEKLEFLQEMKQNMMRKNKENITKLHYNKNYRRIEEEIIRLEEQLKHFY